MVLKINKKEYNRLLNEEMNNPTPWKFKNNLCVESFINNIFDENIFLWRIVFDNEYSILKNKNESKTYIGDLNTEDFDNEYGISFKKGISPIDYPEIISGIVNFPKISWEKINDFIKKVPEAWTVFIINPILMRNDENSVGLFLTPIYCDNIYIDKCNNYIKSKTGYQFFFKYTDEKNIPKIKYEPQELTLENYIKTVKSYSKNKGLSKLLDFWAKNECISVESFELSFKDYKKKLPFKTWHDIDFKIITSYTPFKLIHEETGEIMGPFNKFSLDKSFKLANTDKGVLKLTDTQINGLINGKYDFKLND